MKLRSISLTNVRRFAGTTVRFDGLGDGLNLMAAPNEAGKSTAFEALQVLLFVPCRSAGAEARSLRPYAGGAPEVAAEVELAGARYRIAKRWLQRPFARVAELPSGRIGLNPLESGDDRGSALHRLEQHLGLQRKAQERRRPQFGQLFREAAAELVSPSPTPDEGHRSGRR